MIPDVSRRGTYYNLDKSPYVVHSPYGDSFKFSSAKKMEIFKREVSHAIDSCNKYWERMNMDRFIPIQTKRDTFKAIYFQVYEGVKNRALQRKKQNCKA